MIVCSVSRSEEGKEEINLGKLLIETNNKTLEIQISHFETINQNY